MYKSILRTAKVAVEKVTSIGLIALMAMLSFMVVPQSASAADLDTESLSQSNPTVSQTGNVFTLTLGNVSTTLIRCIEINFTTAVGGATLPTGMDITFGSITPSGTYITGGLAAWTADSNPNAYTYRLTNATGATSPGGDGLTIVLTGVGNGSTPDTAFFAEVNTFALDTCATPVDTDGIATFVFTEGVVVSATVNPSLTFTVDLTTCSLGVLTASTTGSCSHTMTAASNATSGYAISYIASGLLTSPGGDDITAMSGTTSSIGTEQFGINLVDNATPDVGANASGGSGAPIAPYATADNFTFTTAGASVATTSGPSAVTTFTVSYIANITSATEAGLYTKTQTYNITATY